MPNVTVKNTAKSNQFVNTAGGVKTLAPGQSGEAEFSDGEFASMKRNPFLELTVDGKVVSGKESDAKAAPVAKGVVWGEGKNEVGQDLKKKPLSKKEQREADQKELDALRLEAERLGIEGASEADAETLKKAIDEKKAQ